MTESAVDQPSTTVLYEPRPATSGSWLVLMRALLLLAFPIIGESVLNMFVGLTDTFLAGHLAKDAVPATAAVGSVSYVLWLVGLIVSTIGSGSTAIIARAAGARHRSLANSVAGQSITAAVTLGCILAAFAMVFADPLADLTGLTGQSHDFAQYYIRILALSLPFSTVMFVAGACLRGAGDTLSPAIASCTVDGCNILISGTLARGWFGVHSMGFRGIAIGTVIAYVIGGLLLLAVLYRGGRGGKIRLHLHRMRPHWRTMKRVLRIGMPSGIEGLITWIAQFAIVVMINRSDTTNVRGSAHIITIRLESLSFMIGFAIASAAATMVGQSLGMRDPRRATRCAYIGFGLAALLMCSWGAAFMTIPIHLARVLTSDPNVSTLAATCLFITGFSQLGFSAALTFGGALRGAGDTLVVMIVNLSSILLIRFLSVYVALTWFHMGLAAVWMILASELSFRGILLFIRFRHGGWSRIDV